MRVLKIVKANHDLFGSEQNKQYTEKEAIRIVASMKPKGNKIQDHTFEIRQAHSAICNLLSLGFNEDAIELAKKLIPKAELTQQYYIAQDLCHKLIAHFYFIDDIESVNIYQSLYNRFTLNVSYEHEAMLLCNKTIHNFMKLGDYKPANPEELNKLIEEVEKKLPFDNTWYHYYYFLYKSLSLEGKSLEQLYLSAYAYFDNLHYNHKDFSEVFLERLIMYYLDANELENIEKNITLLSPGSMAWFRTNYAYTQILINQNDLKSNDICEIVMNHPKFTNIHATLKDKWKAIYKMVISLLLDS